jgi:integrase
MSDTGALAIEGTALDTLTRPRTLTDADRAALIKRRIAKEDREAVAPLWAPFRDVFTERVRPADRTHQAVWKAFRFCAQAMLALQCTYWAFTWDHLLAWREETRLRESARPAIWWRQWNQCWREVTATLFLLGVLPYRETIYQHSHRDLATKWLGEEQARTLTERFVEMARRIGYRHERQVRNRGASVLLSVMVASQKRDVAALTRADFAAWEAHTGRSPKVATSGVTMAPRVLGAMGYLGGESPRSLGGGPRTRLSWGRTAPQIVVTFERFLADLAATRRPTTVTTYRATLRRFGDWLGTVDPAVTSVAEVHRRHIEAYKQAITRMRVGEHATPAHKAHLGRRLGAPLSAWFQIRCLSCLKTFFDTIDVLEYPERPGRPLFVRGDLKRVDVQTPRFLPDADWHRFVAAVERLTPEAAAARRLPLPFERMRAVLAILLECGLRAGELLRLDTGCIVTAQDAATGEVTHWLRVPVGKLRNDRMVPIRPAVVEAVDAWMRQRGPQPLLDDERTNTRRDYLFAWQGGTLSQHSLTLLIAALCRMAGISRYTSHQFRHTLAVQWRRNGMRLETIGQLLGHKSLQMTLRYAAVMPETVRQEFDRAFAAIDEEHRTTAQVRIVLSPEAHLAASAQWRESLWVDLGIGWCGLSAYLPCSNRLACLPCPHFIGDQEHLPLYERRRGHLIELRMLGEGRLTRERKEELDGAARALDALDQTLRTAQTTQTARAAVGAPVLPVLPVVPARTAGGRDLEHRGHRGTRGTAGGANA